MIPSPLVGEGDARLHVPSESGPDEINENAVVQRCVSNCGREKTAATALRIIRRGEIDFEQFDRIQVEKEPSHSPSDRHNIVRKRRSVLSIAGFGERRKKPTRSGPFECGSSLPHFRARDRQTTGRFSSAGRLTRNQAPRRSDQRIPDAVRAEEEPRPSHLGVECSARRLSASTRLERRRELNATDPNA